MPEALIALEQARLAQLAWDKNNPVQLELELDEEDE